MLHMDAEFSLGIVERNFDRSKPARFVAGLAISTDRQNSLGVSFLARGLCDLKLPVPLLLNHNHLQPAGRVIDVKVVEDWIYFRAELCNKDDGFYCVRPIWNLILSGELAHASVGTGGQIGPQREEGKITRWNLVEISLTECPADDGASIERVWEKSTVVYCDGRASETVHWERGHAPA